MRPAQLPSVLPADRLCQLNAAQMGIARRAAAKRAVSAVSALLRFSGSTPATASGAVGQLVAELACRRAEHVVTVNEISSPKTSKRPNRATQFVWSASGRMRSQPPTWYQGGTWAFGVMKARKCPRRNRQTDAGTSGGQFAHRIVRTAGIGAAPLRPFRSRYSAAPYRTGGVNPNRSSACGSRVCCGACYCGLGLPSTTGAARPGVRGSSPSGGGGPPDRRVLLSCRVVEDSRGAAW